MAAPNGMQPGGGAPYGLGAAIMPSAGHHHDMQHVWSLVEELSGLLQQNREEWNELQAGISKAQIRLPDAAEPAATDGEGEDTSAAERAPAEAETVAELRTKLVQAERETQALEAAYKDQSSLVTAFENGMHDTAGRLRNYVFEQEKATNALKRRHEEELALSRNETLQAQLVHQAWQASLARVSEGVRLAYRDKTERALPYMRKIAALREENRLLRQKVGWDPPSDDEDDVGEGGEVVGGEWDGAEEEEGEGLGKRL